MSHIEPGMIGEDTVASVVRLTADEAKKVAEALLKAAG